MKTSALVLLKMSVNSWYLEGTLERSGASVSFVELAWISEEWRQGPKLLEPRSFDVYKNAAVPMIAMLSYSELDMKILDVDIETIGSDDCRGMFRKDRDANGVLAVMWEGARFFHKDR